MEKSRAHKLIDLARELARQRTDKGLEGAAEIFLKLIDEGYRQPPILIQAAVYILQGPSSTNPLLRNKAVSLAEQAVALAPDDLRILDKAIQCYELVLNYFPEKLNEIIKLSLKVLELDPNHIEAMIILATYREQPDVGLSLQETIHMLEWAKEVDPGNVIVDFLLARSYSEIGQTVKAGKLYKEIIASSAPDSQDALNARDQIKKLHRQSKNKHYRKYGMN